MSGITTHVLDTSRGRPAAGIAVTLWRWSESGEAAAIATAVTNDDGRIGDLLQGEPLTAGVYQLSFATGDYFAASDCAAFYPQVDITFQVPHTDQHYHVPLLLSPFGYSTYRGS